MPTTCRTIELVTEILSADGTDPTTRGAAKFYLDRLADPNLLTRDVGRMFLGRDLQCAQCHDHPLIDDYKQAHYYGIFAFLNRTTLFEDDKKDVGARREGRRGRHVHFGLQEEGHAQNRPAHPGRAESPSSRACPRGPNTWSPPDKQNKVRPIPRYSRRAELARRLTSDDVPEFSRNIVNRLWALMMGRGLVHPVDLHHAENPPADAELLDLLAREFVAMRLRHENVPPRAGPDPGLPAIE